MNKRIRLVSVNSRGVDITPRRKQQPLPPHEPADGLNIPDVYFRTQKGFSLIDWAMIAIIVLLLIAGIALAVGIILQPIQVGKIHAEWYEPAAVERHVEFKDELVRRVCRDCQVAVITPE